MIVRKYAYKGYVYEVELGQNGNPDVRQMRFRDTDNIYNLDQYGDITLEEFKSIVEQWLDW